MEVELKTEDLAAMSVKEKETRSNECSEKINAILKEYNCEITVSGFVIVAK